MASSKHDPRSIVEALLGDGSYLLSLSGIALILSGGFAILQSVSGHFLPHDVQALLMDADVLAERANPQVVQFMFHDRVAFGGSLLSVGFLYWWLAEFPLRTGASWVWWTYLVTGVSGFGSFLTYLGYGYFDTWHGVATMILIPFFIAGMVRARRRIIGPSTWRDLWWSACSWPPPERTARLLFSLCALGLVLAGGTILIVGATSVFVPQDLEYFHMTPDQLHAVSPHLVPVIAHDRSGFGGGLLSTGLLILLIIRNAAISPSLIQILGLAGLAGFGCAIGVHFVIGYLSFVHLAPAYAGFLLFAVAWFVAWRSFGSRDRESRQ